MEKQVIEVGGGGKLVDCGGGLRVFYMASVVFGFLSFLQIFLPL